MKQHLNQLVGNIASAKSAVSGQTYDDFRQNEQTKEAVYHYLQEIGQVAFEISNSVSQEVKSDLGIEPLVALKNARYNQEAEINHQNAWNVVTKDLPEIGERIEQSSVYAN